MKAVRCKDHKACLTHVPSPSGEGVRVRVAAAGICGTDLHFIQAGFEIPFTLGHEIAGITEDGTAVAIAPSVSPGPITVANAEPPRCSVSAAMAAWRKN
jgi:D-arabinose 1-dehydrogenase-like Zn-dependent alcohol dehydrogenase